MANENDLMNVLCVKWNFLKVVQYVFKLIVLKIVCFKMNCLKGCLFLIDL